MGAGPAALGGLPLIFKQVHVFRDSGVLMIGDSHTLISRAHRPFEGYDVDARSGRESAEGMNVLSRYLRPDHRVVVFDLATNDHADPARFESNLALLETRVGPRKLVMVNCWRQDGANSHRGVNQALACFVARQPERASLVDWASYIDDHPGLLGQPEDWVHFSLDAYRIRAAMVNAAISSTLEGSEAGHAD